MTSTAQISSHPNVVFFDGVCGFCNGSVDFLMRRDKRAVLKFSPIQGELAKSLLSEERRENIDTIVYVRSGEIFVKSTAALEIGRDVGGWLKLFYPLIVLPASWRDWTYNLIARNRYKWFGKKEACRIPTQEERARFID